jgi:plasmid maintenance system killer protein
MAKVSKKLQAKLEVLKDSKSAMKLWKLYKKYYKKNYTDPEEEKERLGKFIDNLKLIIQENFRFDEGLKSFKLQLNQFGDMNLEEFRQKLTGLNADGQGEKPPGEVLEEKPQGEVFEEENNQRMKRFLVDSIKNKIKNKIKKKLSPGKSRPSDSGMYVDPSSHYSSGTRINPSAKRPTSRLASKGTVDYRQYMNPVENQGRCGLVFFFENLLL